MASRFADDDKSDIPVVAAVPIGDSALLQDETRISSLDSDSERQYSVECQTVCIDAPAAPPLSGASLNRSKPLLQDTDVEEPPSRSSSFRGPSEITQPTPAARTTRSTPPPGEQHPAGEHHRQPPTSLFADPSPDDHILPRNNSSSMDGSGSRTKSWFGIFTTAQLILVFLLLAVLVLLVVTLTKGEASPSKNTPGSPSVTENGPSPLPGIVATSTLDLVVQSGSLRCGVVPGLDGFSVLNPETDIYEGFEVDLCRAIAAAVLGVGDNNVEFVPVTTTGRFKSLADGDVDVLASHNTLTMDRDVYELTAETGFTFSAPYLYDGLVFAGQPEFVACANNFNTTGSCSNLRICVIEGTTHLARVRSIIPGATINQRPNPEDAFKRFEQSLKNPGSGCNVLAGAQFEVAESVVRRSISPFNQEYEVGAVFHSREPLALVTRDGDPTWSEMVDWVLQAILAAEEENITKDSAASELATTPYFGSSLSSFFRDAVSAVGNYEEIYERHLEKILPRTAVNTINTGQSGGIFSHPFGSYQTLGPEPTDGSTLKEITDRGHLRCGISRYPGFAEFDPVLKEWYGFDIDFCKALSASIFFGASDNVIYTVLPATHRFTALANGNVDVLSRYTTWNLERDVMETASGEGFDFSQVNFYDALSVGGKPPYGKCADNEDWVSQACQDLRVCVGLGTTTIEVARGLFPESIIVERSNSEQVVWGLIAGSCNAIFGGLLEIVEPTLRELGYTGTYEMGTTIFSKEPLALVTRQDDPQFSSFVKWIVSATFYAEEEGIEQQNAEEMPTVSLFGPLYRRMMVDAIQAVGNYGQIYNRNVEAFEPRKDLNELSVNGPRHYSRPGIIDV
mmetsp:Transcript_27130/g.45231  ORF Transcript_27130/g.45231 Transcript_27130/m.45231 type:complete len:851 (-) Transcript_27130:149-2701(-)|eukprot:CAMPEP_0119026398 /NCGR_PEP_ID=MMETSP1176-20130426/35364_1 /TAXON_ID=265551 /ORGANISM="Synedropsis recta cf, Strain CCMP1620" /LENGTH=850 /DNA_ID=CAMNT_0006982101 /DNA_START=106 /DNA_END=2658 /DNA_ORIENTATION=-